VRTAEYAVFIGEAVYYSTNETKKGKFELKGKGDEDTYLEYLGPG